jgi:hypothetical protein
VWASPHSQLDRPVAFPEDGIRGQGKAVGIKTPPTALLFWCGFCLKPMPERRFPPPWSISLRGALTGRQIFSVIKGRLEVSPGGVVVARLICTRCRADTKSILRCRACGTLCPTSEIGAAMLSPSAFTFYVLGLVVVAIFWFT